MNIWENAVITVKGLSLLSKLIEGDTLDITRAETGAGYVTPGTLSQLTSVSMPKQALTFRGTSYPEEGKCKLPCYLTNSGLKAGYTAKQVGVYATDPDEGEILFLVMQSPSDKGTEVPSETEMPGYSAEWNLYIQYGQASGVKVVVDATGVVSRGEVETLLEEQKAEIKEEFESELGDKVGHDMFCVRATSEDGVYYVANIEGIPKPYVGMTITIIPNKTSTDSTVSLNLNNDGAHVIHMPNATGSSEDDWKAPPEGWIREGYPLRLMFTGSVWKTDVQHLEFVDIYGTVPVSKGGTGATSAAAARTNLQVAKNVHKHNAADIDSGILSSDRFPTIPITKGGTGAADSSKARENLGIRAEYFVFTLEDGSTVTKLVYVG